VSNSTRRNLFFAWLVRGLAIVFLTFDAVIKLTQTPMAVDATVRLGYPSSIVLPLGLLELVLLLLYVVPKTSVIGALLWTGYLGGAVATHVRLSNPLFSHVLVPTYVAGMLWGGLMITDPLLRRVLWRTHVPGRDSEHLRRSSELGQRDPSWNQS
jgi:hypothetical protein